MRPYRLRLLCRAEINRGCNVCVQAVGVHKVRVAVPVATHVLVSGVAASRWGLWTFDLAVSQLLQERVPDDQLSTLTHDLALCHRAVITITCR